jgi:hypothetical protein
VLPHVKAALDHFSSAYSSLLWGDISNINGGHFPPHLSHGDGRDFDGVFSGYDDPTQTQTIIYTDKCGQQLRSALTSCPKWQV